MGEFSKNSQKDNKKNQNKDLMNPENHIDKNKPINNYIIPGKHNTSKK
jgi:hypothetical protein